MALDPLQAEFEAIKLRAGDLVTGAFTQSQLNKVLQALTDLRTRTGNAPIIDLKVRLFQDKLREALADTEKAKILLELRPALDASEVLKEAKKVLDANDGELDWWVQIGRLNGAFKAFNTFKDSFEKLGGVLDDNDGVILELVGVLEELRKAREKAKEALGLDEEEDGDD